MTISPAGIRLLKFYEGCRLTAYKDAVGVWTIGYGSTGPHVKEGMTITQEQAEALLKQDLQRFEKGVRELVKVPLTQGQYDSLVSLAFNVGLGALGNSTLLKKLNIMDYNGAARQFGEWIMGGNTILRGLVRRRVAEVVLFMGGSPP